MSVYDPFTDEERRQRENRMKRISRDSQQQDESRIQRWLDLAKQMFDKDDDPGAQTA